MGFESFKNLRTALDPPIKKTKTPRRSMFNNHNGAKGDSNKPKSLPRRNKTGNNFGKLTANQKRKYKMSINKRDMPTSTSFKKNKSKANSELKSKSKNQKKRKAKSRLKGKRKSRNREISTKKLKSKSKLKSKLKMEVKESMNQRVGKEFAQGFRMSLENIDKSIGMMVENLSLADSEHKNSRRCSLVDSSGLLASIKHSEGELPNVSKKIYSAHPTQGKSKNASVLKGRKNKSTAKKRLKKPTNGGKKSLKESREPKNGGEKNKSETVSSSYNRSSESEQGPMYPKNGKSRKLSDLGVRRQSGVVRESHGEFQTGSKGRNQGLTDLRLSEKTRGSRTGVEYVSDSQQGKSFLDWSQRTSGLTQSEVTITRLWKIILVWRNLRNLSAGRRKRRPIEVRA